MTLFELGILFEKHNEEFLHFDRVQVKLSKRPDLHAFILLDKISPSEFDMVCSSEHDEIFLEVHPTKIENEDQVIDLIRCGVRFDSAQLLMFT